MTWWVFGQSLVFLYTSIHRIFAECNLWTDRNILYPMLFVFAILFAFDRFRLGFGRCSLAILLIIHEVASRA